MKSIDKVLEALIWRDGSKKQDCLVRRANSELKTCIVASYRCLRNGIVDTEWNHGYRGLADAKFCSQLLFHPARVDEDVVHQPILNAQREPVEPAVVAVPASGIHVMDRQNQALPVHPVIEHQNRAVEELNLVVPEDVKYLCIACSGVANQLVVIRGQACEFAQQVGIVALIAA